MDARQVIATLRRLGKASTARIYRNHGVKDRVLGVPHGELDKLARRLRGERALVRALWDSGIHEARLLAARIEDPAQVPVATLEAWLGETGDYIVADAIAALAASRPEPWALARRWIRSRHEWTGAAGWSMVALLAMRQALDVAEADRLIGQIRRGIGRAKNRTRHSMNSALIAIGGSMAELTDVAKIAAHNIGEVVVDHGQTGCVTPDAIAYIDRMVQRNKARPRASSPAPRARQETGTPARRTTSSTAREATANRKGTSRPRARATTRGAPRSTAGAAPTRRSRPRGR